MILENKVKYLSLYHVLAFRNQPSVSKLNYIRALLLNYQAYDEKPIYQQPYLIIQCYFYLTHSKKFTHLRMLQGNIPLC